MLHKYYHIHLTIARKVNILLLALICGLIILFVFRKAAVEINHLSGGVGIIDTKFIYSPAEVALMLEAYGQKGRTLYMIVEATVGLVLPVVYALMLSMLIVYWFHRLQINERTVVKLLLLPFLAFVFDYLENLLIIAMLYTYPVFSVGVSFMATFFTAFKWISIAGSVLVCIIGAVALCISYIKPGLTEKESI